MPTFVRIHEAAVASYIMPGGEVSDLLNEVGRMTQTFARGHVKSRSGALAGNIRMNYARPTSNLTANSMVYANIRHALWVHEGTGKDSGGFIYPNGKYLTLPKDLGGSIRGGALYAARTPRGPKTYFFAKKVRGQAANPYLAKGLKDAMALIR